MLDHIIKIHNEDFVHLNKGSGFMRNILIFGEIFNYVLNLNNCLTSDAII